MNPITIWLLQKIPKYQLISYEKEDLEFLSALCNKSSEKKWLSPEELMNQLEKYASSAKEVYPPLVAQVIARPNENMSALLLLGRDAYHRQLTSWPMLAKAIGRLTLGEVMEMIKEDRGLNLPFLYCLALLEEGKYDRIVRLRYLIGTKADPYAAEKALTSFLLTRKVSKGQQQEIMLSVLGMHLGLDLLYAMYLQEEQYLFDRILLIERKRDSLYEVHGRLRRGSNVLTDAKVLIALKEDKGFVKALTETVRVA